MFRRCVRIHDRPGIWKSTLCSVTSIFSIHVPPGRGKPRFCSSVSFSNLSQPVLLYLELILKENLHFFKYCSIHSRHGKEKSEKSTFCPFILESFTQLYNFAESVKHAELTKIPSKCLPLWPYKYYFFTKI